MTYDTALELAWVQARRAARCDGCRDADVLGRARGRRAVTLVRIVAPHFVAAVVADSVVRECAPILSYMTGWNGRQVADYCKRKGWRWEVVA